MDRASSGGATRKISLELVEDGDGSSSQDTNRAMDSWATRPSQDLSWAESSPNQGRSDSMPRAAAVARAELPFRSLLTRSASASAVGSDSVTLRESTMLEA